MPPARRSRQRIPGHPRQAAPPPELLHLFGRLSPAPQEGHLSTPPPTGTSAMLGALRITTIMSSLMLLLAKQGTSGIHSPTMKKASVET